MSIRKFNIEKYSPCKNGLRTVVIQDEWQPSMKWDDIVETWKPAYPDAKYRTEYQ